MLLSTQVHPRHLLPISYQRHYKLVLGNRSLCRCLYDGLAQYEEQGVKIMDSFSQMLATTCTVIRDENAAESSSRAVGSVISFLSTMATKFLQMVLLCAEVSRPRTLVDWRVGAHCLYRSSVERGYRMFECKNMALIAHCLTVAIGLVMRTGDKTAIGTIAMLASDTEQRSTLQKEVRSFVKLIAIVAVTMAALCFVGSVYLQKARARTPLSSSLSMAS
jgi:hypothetical protein